MTLTDAPQTTDPAGSYAAFRDRAPQELRSSKPIDPGDPQLFTVTQRHFVIGGQQLILEKYPQIAVYPGQFEFEIVGWHIRLPYGKQDQIGREMIRKFIFLHAKAERLDLGEQEEAEWRDIAKQVDYRRFSIDRSPPKYVQGVLLDRSDMSCRVEWHDGTTDRISGAMIDALRIVNVGENFIGLARFGENNVLRQLTDVTPTLPFDGDEGERMWREWPVSR